MKLMLAWYTSYLTFLKQVTRTNSALGPITSGAIRRSVLRSLFSFRFIDDIFKSSGTVLNSCLQTTQNFIHLLPFCFPHNDSNELGLQASEIGYTNLSVFLLSDKSGILEYTEIMEINQSYMPTTSTV